MVDEAIENYGQVWCLMAMNIAEKRERKNWKYVTGILGSWKSKFGETQEPWKLEQEVVNGTHRNIVAQSGKSKHVETTDWGDDLDYIPEIGSDEWTR